MNTISLIKCLVEENDDGFKENLSNIMNTKIQEKKQILAFETLNKVFESTESLNTEKPNYEVISVLQECVKQNSNIVLVLEDGKEQTLRPSDSKQVLLVFDNLNESNQTDLINRLVQTSTNFFNTIEFCLKFKERYT
mgnify:CR=1 FL=1|tara:strand:- start:176 stop:586 length:411 start_codon:yes stop_codon:yes gene_type:complete